MLFSTISVALCAFAGLAAAAPAPEVSIQERSAALIQPWEIHPTEFKVVTNVTKVDKLPAGTKGHNTKREAESAAIEERAIPFGYVLGYGSSYTTYPNTYYYLPYIAGTCLSFSSSGIDNAIGAVNILQNTAVYCYFFVDYVCGFNNGYTYFTYFNTPQNANSFQYHQWSSYICYGA